MGITWITVLRLVLFRMFCSAAFLCLQLTLWQTICASHVPYKFTSFVSFILYPVQSTNSCFGFTIYHREAAFARKSYVWASRMGRPPRWPAALHCWIVGGPSLTFLPLQPPATPGALPCHLTHPNLPYIFSSTLMSLYAPIAVFQMLPETPLYPNAHVTSLI